MTEARRDRRVERTRRLLHRALMTAVRERGWDAVSVRDVCERADVGRSTFYVHFADKEELFLSGFAELKKALRLTENKEGKPLAFILSLFEHARENENILIALRSNRVAQRVHQALVDMLVELIDEELANFTTDALLREAAARYVAGAFWELLSWSGGKRKFTVGEIEQTFRRLTTPILRDLQRSAR